MRMPSDYIWCTRRLCTTEFQRPAFHSETRRPLIGDDFPTALAKARPLT